MIVQTELKPGLIMEIAEAARLPLLGGNEEKKTLRCPFHNDKTPSAFLSATRNLFFCSCCGGFSAKAFAEKLGVPWRKWRREEGFFRKTKREIGFSFDYALQVAKLSLERTRSEDPEILAEDLPVYAFLRSRGLQETWELGVFGILPSEESLPAPIKWWWVAGFRLVVPLRDLSGHVVSLQARAVISQEKKVMTPKGALISGTVFADYLGLEVLQGRWGKGRSVILGEGLTDFLALAISSPYPVLSIPGVATAKSAIGEWVRGRVVHLCFDCDAAGEKAVRDVAPLIRAHGGKPVRISWYGGLKDAGEMIQRYGAHGLSEFLDRVLKLGDSND